MKTQLRPAGKAIPHPLLTVAGVVVAFALAIIALKTTLLPRPSIVVIAVGFVIIFRWLSRRSAKTMNDRRKQELEDLRHTRVLNLDD
jgi:Flp pilus assembly protein TadB